MVFFRKYRIIIDILHREGIYARLNLLMTAVVWDKGKGNERWEESNVFIIWCDAGKKRKNLIPTLFLMHLCFPYSQRDWMSFSTSDLHVMRKKERRIKRQKFLYQSYYFLIPEGWAISSFYFRLFSIFLNWFKYILA